MNGPSPIMIVLAAFALACEDPSASTPTPKTSGQPQVVSAASAKLDKQALCRELIAVVNRTVEESHKITGTLSGDGTKELEALSASAARAKTEVEKLAGEDPTVMAARDGYLRMLTTTIQSANETVRAAREKDFEAMEKASDALTKAVASEEAVVGRINAACGVGAGPTP
jgi:hypothetical protein